MRGISYGCWPCMTVRREKFKPYTFGITFLPKSPSQRRNSDECVTRSIFGCPLTAGTDVRRRLTSDVKSRLNLINRKPQGLKTRFSPRFANTICDCKIWSALDELETVKNLASSREDITKKAHDETIETCERKSQDPRTPSMTDSAWPRHTSGRKCTNKVSA